MRWEFQTNFTQCLDFKIAKIFFKADISKELPKSMNFTFQGRKNLVEFNYPWLPPRCSYCEKWGHLDSVCLAKPNLKEVSEEQTTSPSKEKPLGTCQKNTETEKGTSSVLENVDPRSNSGGLENVEKSQEKKTLKDSVTSNLNNENQEKERSNVTPTKIGKSPNKKKNIVFGEVSILPNS